ncbi:hypothetical protein lerEdw1_011941 [Lerista edwardsae]|nr:hypothetical protein lerEdw1_011941 [Lerista edwardsae]
MRKRLDHPHQDLAEAAAIERRRFRELQKQSRVFDARLRTIGTNGKKRDIQNQNKALNEFRQQYQKPETRREFDLNDPQALKKDIPARLADSDPRCTVSSMQKFMGEDLNKEKRHKFQKEQTREWLLQQQKDWKNALADKKFADDLHDQQRLELDKKAMDLERAHEATRRALCLATKDFNKVQAAELKEKRQLEYQQGVEDDVAEIANLLSGDLLSENPHQAVSSFGEGRVLTDRWKGMSQDQLKEIRDIQLQQVLEKMRLEEEELQRNDEWDRQRIQAARAELLFERHQQRQNRDLRRALDNFNAQLSQEQKSRLWHLQFLDPDLWDPSLEILIVGHELGVAVCWS